ncbi:50S ribosomal protein L17 [candidate division WS5 bacterium]|uniref:Large ribosomal subunit protein bL17 n=1 Tax=candidate division WS5 bacterium TaxID=2093353 RepID=A0A419DA92_9BACT|nr:MAG: 50S ribosomal protein L17 [candidate division WS5 bacterium]
MHKHTKKIRKFGREKAPRELMFRNLATSIILHEKVKTTLPKAKEIRPTLEKLITTAKKGDLSSIRKLHSYLLDKNAVQKLLVEIAPLYKERNGGYTRITKLGPRIGDGAEMALFELLDTDKLVKRAKEEQKETEKKKTAKKESVKTAKASKEKEAKGAKK